MGASVENLRVALRAVLASQAAVRLERVELASGLDPAELDVGCCQAGEGADGEDSSPHLGRGSNGQRVSRLALLQVGGDVERVCWAEPELAGGYQCFGVALVHVYRGEDCMGMSKDVFFLSFGSCSCRGLEKKWRRVMRRQEHTN